MALKATAETTAAVSSPSQPAVASMLRAVFQHGSVDADAVAFLRSTNITVNMAEQNKNAGK